MFKATPQSTVQTNTGTSQHTLSASKLGRDVLSDSQLLHLCQHYGSQAKLWKQKFLGLLPEVEKRKLYQQKRCSSIFEFAAKLGGVSREQVQRVLQLGERFESLPVMRELLTNGQVSMHKLARVASVATEQNQNFWASQSKLLSQPALETLVRDTKSVRSHSLIPNKTQKVAQFDELNLSVQTRQRLLVMQNTGLDVDQIVNELLDQREQQIQEEKERIGEELKDKIRVGQRQGAGLQPIRPSRYIPMKVKHLLQQEFGSKCAHEKCVNRSVNLHHTRRFSINPSHNPLYLAPLCKSHHEIAHSVDVRATEFRRR